MFHTSRSSRAVISFFSVLLCGVVPVVSMGLTTQLKSPATTSSVGFVGSSKGRCLLKKSSLSFFFSAPDGAYTLTYHIPSISTAIPLPVGRRVIVPVRKPSFVTMAVPRRSVPMLICEAYPRMWVMVLLVTSCSRIISRS